MGIIGRGHGFRDVRQWYTRIAALERCVCLIQSVGGRPIGTGFLVAPDIVLTASHVQQQSIRDKADPPQVRFDYAVSEASGVLLDGTVCKIEPDGLIDESPVRELDVALFRLASPAGAMAMADSGRARGWVDLNTAILAPEENSFMAIFQHPDGGPLRVAMSTESVAGFFQGGARLLHRTDTSPGSSGAPCFDIDWRPLAMHQAFSFEHGNLNIAVPFSAIVPWLHDRGIWPLVAKPPPEIFLPLTQDTGLPLATPFKMEAELRKALMTIGESQRLELKERAIADGDGKPRLSRSIVQTTAAFMNSKDGGSILIGVTDNRQFVDITKDYALVNGQKASWDGFDLWLRNSLGDQLEGPAARQSFSTVRYRENEQEICAIHVEPARSPIFVGNDFFVRRGPQTQGIRGHEMLAYVSQRWSVFGAMATPDENKQKPQLERR